MTTTVAAPAGDRGSRLVEATSEGRMTSAVTGSTEDGRDIRAGKFTPESFAVEDGAVTVTGTLSGVIPGEGRFAETITTTVESVQTSNRAGTETADLQLVSNHGCDILNLVLGPLDLDLLGLQVHLDQVVLDIVAVPGAGNLLGNLLCAVAGLLDGGLEGLLQDLVDLLNQILGRLGLGL